MTLKKTLPDYLCDEEGKLIDLPAPYPVPDQATYDRVREEALAYSEKRRINYEKYLESSRRDVKPDYMPVRLDIENVSRCNFSCSMCIVDTWEKRQRARDMTLKEFKQLIDEQYGLVEIKIQGMGEPTMQRDIFFEMIRYARSKRIWVRIITNASLLHLRDNYKKLIDSGVNEIQISIDGATKEVFEGIRKGAVFERVVENCKLINGYATEKNIIRTKMWTVVQKNNQHQVKDIIDLGKSMGFKQMVFSLNMIDFGMHEMSVRNNAQSIEKTFSNREALKHMEYAKSIGVDARFWRQTDKYSIDRPETLCPWPFERAYISSDMRIVPCCILGNPDAADLGEAAVFNENWLGDHWQKFRQAHLEGNPPSVCVNCYQAVRKS